MPSEGATVINPLLSGATTLAFITIGVFFLRFWRKSGDRLFVIFAVAFWLMAGNRLGLTLMSEEREQLTWLYAVRLLAFILILVAIIDKNRAAKRMDP
jgi:hypothetical protein